MRNSLRFGFTLLQRGAMIGLSLGALVFGNPVDGMFNFDDTQAGTASLPFLKLPMGARAAAMGGFDGPAINDPSTVFWNPARIPLVEGFQTQFSHGDYLGQWRHEAASSVFAVPRIGNLGLGFSGLFATPFEGARNIEENDVKIVAMDFSLGLAWGYPLLADRLWVGSRLNWIHSQLDDVPGDGYGLDLSGSWNMFYGLQGSFSLQNLAHGFSYRSGTGAVSKLPTLLRTGLGFADSTSAWGWQIGYSKSNDAGQRLHVGGEWNWQHLFFARTGYERDLHNPELGWMRGISAGLGLQLSTLGVEYAIKSMGNIGLVHTVTLQVHPPLRDREVIDFMKLARQEWEHGACNLATQYARKALRQDPSKLDAVAIIQACEKEGRVDKAKYVAIAYSANTEGQALSFWEQDRLNGGLSRRFSLIKQLRMQYPALQLLDAGRLFPQDTAEKNSQRILDLYAKMSYQKILLSENDAPGIRRAGAENLLPWIQKDPCSILSVNGKDVAVFGFSGKSSPGPSVVDMVAQIQKARQSWSKPPALQVLLLDAPLQIADSLVRQVSGIDLMVLSGEEPLIPRPMKIQNTWISSPGRRGEALGFAVAWFDQGPAPAWDFRMIPINDAIRPDSGFAQSLGEEWRVLAGQNSRAVLRSDYEDFLYLQKVEDGRSDVWLADHKSGLTSRLTRSPAKILDAQMAWSRNSFFHLAQSDSGKGQLTLQQVGNKASASKVDSLGNVLFARWEPYENWLYYVREDDPSSRNLFRMTWKGTHEVNMSRGELGLVNGFSFASDGQNMALECVLEGRSRIVHAGLTLSHREFLSPDSLDAKYPVFSPSGVFIAYASRTPDGSDSSWNIMLWDSRNDQQRELAKGRDIHGLKWSMDGKYLLLESGMNRKNIQVLDVETGEETPLKISLEEISEETRVRAHRWKAQDGILYQSESEGKIRILWSPLTGSVSPVSPIETDSPALVLPLAE